MSVEDPYTAPGAAVSDPADPASSIDWKRIAGWGALICAVVTSIYILGGIVDSRLMFYGMAVDEITASIASFALYLAFLNATPHRHFLQLMWVFLAVQILCVAVNGALGLLLMLLAGDPFDDLISFAEIGRSLLVCLLAYAVWYLTARRSRSK